VSSAIKLRHTDPLIWRQVEVADLDHAHDIIQPARGWFDDHLWESTIDKQTYGLPMIAAGSRVKQDEVWAGDHPGQYTAEEKAAEIARLKARIARLEAPLPPWSCD
jgi:Plasmid pRiA4b ORF-3-like protein